jgi:hypothetical protein
MALFSGCAMYQSPGGSSPGGLGLGSPPTLSSVSVSPNPTYPGSIVNLTAAYMDPDADLEYGVAAISVNGGKLSRIAFRSTYISGILTIPIPVSYYSRSSNVQISLSIRDSSGNWSNTISTVLAIR